MSLKRRGPHVLGRGGKDAENIPQRRRFLPPFQQVRIKSRIKTNFIPCRLHMASTGSVAALIMHVTEAVGRDRELNRRRHLYKLASEFSGQHPILTCTRSILTAPKIA